MLNNVVGKNMNQGMKVGEAGEVVGLAEWELSITSNM
jgi:hypothetical protein